MGVRPPKCCTSARNGSLWTQSVTSASSTSAVGSLAVHGATTGLDMSILSWQLGEVAELGAGWRGTSTTLCRWLAGAGDVLRLRRQSHLLAVEGRRADSM